MSANMWLVRGPRKLPRSRDPEEIQLTGEPPPTYINPPYSTVSVCGTKIVPHHTVNRRNHQRASRTLETQTAIQPQFGRTTLKETQGRASECFGNSTRRVSD